MIISDFSQLVIANVVTNPQDFRNGSTDLKAALSLIRHTTLATLLSYKRAYGRQYGHLVIATDGNNYWRKDEFPYYKASRKKMRQESEFDWQMIFDAINTFKAEFEEVFHYPLVQVPRAEADDVIAALCEYSQENELFSNGLVEEPQPLLILSSDGDFKQLHKYPNVSQWSPLLKKYVTASGDGIAFDLMEKIIKGDSGDGVPNFYMPDDHFVNGTTRQKSVMAARLAEFVVKGRDACQNDTERRNFDRNKRLVDLSQIPVEVSEDIVADYIAKSQRKPDRMKIMAYLNANRCRQLMDSIQDF